MFAEVPARTFLEFLYCISIVFEIRLALQEGTLFNPLPRSKTKNRNLPIHIGTLRLCSQRQIATSNIAKYYFRILRRAKPSPAKPRPINASVAGSGTAPSPPSPFSTIP